MAKRKAKKLPLDIIGPTPEQAQHYDYERAALAYRRIATIDTLLSRGTLSQRQYDGLRRYRDVGVKCDRSEIMDSTARLLHVAGTSNDDGPSASYVRALQDLGWLERELGQLVDIARAIAIEDRTLSEWAMREGGSVMRSETNDKTGKVVIWFEPRKKMLKIAQMDIRMAGERLAAAIGA